MSYVLSVTVLYRLTHWDIYKEKAENKSQIQILILFKIFVDKTNNQITRVHFVVNFSVVNTTSRFICGCCSNKHLTEWNSVLATIQGLGSASQVNSAQILYYMFSIEIGFS